MGAVTAVTVDQIVRPVAQQKYKHSWNEGQKKILGRVPQKKDEMMNTCSLILWVI